MSNQDDDHDTSTGYFLYFRLWPGFKEPFPVDRFDAVADDQDLERALDDYARKELGRLEVRDLVKKVARTRREKLRAGVLQQSKRVRSVGLSKASVRKRLTKREWYWPIIRHADRTDPLVCRLGAYLGWWQKRWNELLPFGPRVWFYQVPNRELAEAFVTHLNGRTNLGYEGNELEYYLKPRFGYVENSDTALQIAAMLNINAILHGKPPEVRAGEAALAMGRKAMVIADEILETLAPPEPTKPVPAGSKPDETKGRSGQADQTQPQKPAVSGDDGEGKPAQYENSLERCKPSARKAYYSFKLAEAKAARRLQDREAWDLLHENDWSESFTGELEDYQFPTLFDTWARQLREARNATNERKYTPRTRR